MVVDRKRKIIVWIIWAFVLPLSIWYAYYFSPVQPEFSTLDFAVFTLIMIPAALLPVTVNYITISLTQWISLAVFLKFGLFAELMITQILVIIVMIRVKLPNDQLDRYAINSAMFALVSILSAEIFYLLGGNHEEHRITELSFLALAAVYMIAIFGTNQLLFRIAQFLLYKVRQRFFTKEVLWEVLSHLVIFPIGLILYSLYNMMGYAGVFLISIPIFSMLLLIKTYNATQNMNNYLQKAAEFGHRLNERLQVDEVLNAFIDNIVKMFPVDYLYIFDQADSKHLELIRSYEKGKYVIVEHEPLRKFEGIAGLAWGTGQALIYREKKEWINIVKGYMPGNAESVLTAPMIRNNEVVGVIFIGSVRKRMFVKFHLMIFDILCSYLAVAIDNARHYEETKVKSERCPLTNLYNARVFNEKLETIVEEQYRNEIKCLSVLMLDIDHFKKINDTYGHESGNDILCQLADLLKTMVGEKGLLARYGGEEFVILLPNMTKLEATTFGEYIRKTIENRTFIMYDDLSEVRRKLSARITVSIGVASAPEDTDEPQSLVRYADRALYIGAKRVGRNKVAGYVG
ncbi:sensor domain-containing diguanylate cyclase [Bacillus kwashiorkori]|uniref:sensor domain-containing diguanylate cyclase n=1 Tax=Bacillus kwashiorkori TaxID=1522318 RepID=UPI000783E194|nr:sensor domain-containing diguanylate cyclase [Bacillus kwashiorkori]